jgi:rod shape determining protein RodA
MIIPTLLLTILGIVVIYSSSASLALQQAIFAFIGLAFYFFLRNIDFRTLKGVVKPAYWVTIFLLIIVFIIGAETRGAVRWVPLGIFNLQPSEFAKVALILFLASFWSRNLPTWRNIFISLGILAPIALLVFKQPDLGTTITLVFIYLVILVGANISIAKLALIFVFSSSLAPIFWFLLRDYQKQRLTTFLSPNLDPQGAGFNVIQSTIAVGSGQLTGRGLGRGTQSRLRFLPEFRTDFIFASIAEELGMVGSLIVLSLYGVIFFILFRLLSRVGDRFGELIILGVASMLFIQIVINIGMNAGLLPITGITLPLLSYGGSSIVTTFIALGLVASVQKFGTKRPDVDTFSL